jgi:NADH dehydrogenase subunit M (EC 1.6.5.3)
VPDLRGTEWLVLGLPLLAALFFGVYSAPVLNLMQPAVRAALSLVGGQ